MSALLMIASYYGVCRCETFRRQGRISSRARRSRPSAVRRRHAPSQRACRRENAVAIHQSVQEEMRPWISSSCSSVAVGTAAAPHSSLMVLQPPWAAATARAITAYIVARVRVAGGPVVDAVLTSMQPYGELVARLRHTMYEAALTAHLSLMQQDTSGAQP